MAAKLSSSANKTSGFELNLYTKTGLGDGKQANNPWLQEFPDPITRASWDNYLTMSIADAKELGFEGLEYVNQLYDRYYKEESNVLAAVKKLTLDLKKQSSEHGLKNVLIMVLLII